MGWFALMVALVAAVAAVLPHPGMFIAMGAAVLAAGLGVAGYRSRQAPGAARLAGAGALTLAIIALILACTRYGLTLMALHKLETVL